jgi:2,5-diamino-6-(ribosylamino)-4(3H)-pyrimidinone 5'-phosphate reductase
MKPYIICHMVSSIDGRIDGAMLGNVIVSGEYEATGAQLKGEAWICGRTTMELHFAEKRRFVSRSQKPSGRQPVFVAQRAKSYAVSVDTTGKLLWSSADVDGDHLICIVSERAPEEYLTMLRAKGISYVVSGKRTVDLLKAVAVLRKHFGIKRLLLEGGGNINGAFLEAGLIDELSVLLVPGIDGRRDIPTVFDGVNPQLKHAARMTLLSVTKRKGGTLWLRYKML